MAAKRIHWTDEERKDVYNRMVEVYAEGKYTSAQNVMRKAQDVLPLGRRRKTYPNMLYKLKDWMLEARMEAHTSARNRKLTEVALETQAAKVAPAPQPTEPTLSELLEKLVDQLAKRVAAEVLKDLSKYLSTQSPPYQNNNLQLEVNPVSVAQPPKVRRKTVTVIGLKGQQVTTIEQSYPELDITFMATQEAIGRKTVTSDHTVLMTKFINHSAQNKYRNAKNLAYCNGGVSELSSILRTIQNI